MGFRLHPGLTSHHLGVKPDLATVGKAIGNGIAVAALIGTPEIMAAFEDQRVSRAGTYSGNPVACAAVKSSMALLDKVDYGAIAAHGDTLRAEIVKGFAEQGIETCTSGYGTVFTLWRGAQLPASYKEAVAIVDPAFTVDLHLELRRAGVMSMATTYGRYYLSASHDQEALDLCAGAFRQAAGRIAGSSRRT
jgi:glutamate-1-semialdehyde 2,1-aminomutase